MATMKNVSHPDAEAKQAHEKCSKAIRQAVAPLRGDFDKLRGDADKLMEGKTT